MNRNKKRVLVVAGVIAGVILLVAIFAKFLNGNLIYISTGFTKGEMLKAGKQTINSMEVNILLSDTRGEYEKVFGTNAWSQSVDGINFDDYAKEQVRSKLARIACMNELAKKKGVALSRNQKEAINNGVDTYYAALSEEQIKSLGITKEKLTDMFTKFATAQVLYEDMTSNLNIEVSADEARIISIQYICADSREVIEEARTRIESGEIFYVVAKEYNGDNYECQLERGLMDEAFEKTAYELKSGQTSDIIEAGDKFYIIKCNSDNEKSKTEANRIVLLEKKKLEAFNKQFEPYEAGIYVDVNKKAWSDISTANVIQLQVNFEEIYNQYLKE